MNESAPFSDIGRKNPSRGVHLQLGRPNWVLLTVTVEDRRSCLASEQILQHLHETWEHATAWLISDYLLMPDHLHCFCAPQELAVPIEDWITYWKRDFRRRHGKTDWKFQSRGWHHRLRDGENYSAKWLYVQENPVRKGLVQHIDQ